MLVGYARVSTQEQNLDLQISSLKEIGCEKIFTEKASGAQRDRPELFKALEYIRSGDVLVVWKLDRLARSMRQLIETIEMLESRKIGFKSITEHMDTTTNGGKLIFHIFASLAEFERSIIKERTMAGLREARLQGKIGGRPRSLSNDDVEMIKGWLAESKKVNMEQIAKRIGISPATLYRYFPGGKSLVNE
jgi:DNA invertase Pin-like site-specific DNA recombinase